MFSGTALPFLLLRIVLAMACYSGFPGVFALRCSSGVATLLLSILTLAIAVPVSGSAFAFPGSSGAETKVRVVALDSVHL